MKNISAKVWQCSVRYQIKRRTESPGQTQRNGMNEGLNLCRQSGNLHSPSLLQRPWSTLSSWPELTIATASNTAHRPNSSINSNTSRTPITCSPTPELVSSAGSLTHNWSHWQSSSSLTKPSTASVNHYWMGCNNILLGYSWSSHGEACWPLSIEARDPFEPAWWWSGHLREPGMWHALFFCSLKL